ncbi:MAG: hypothetical protein MUE69_07510 [Myxococcota bacterium]|nr:hypothetical protein [Myxococcota bacterium]
MTDGDPSAPPGSPVPEPVRRIVDRNGNTMTFAYDAEQRVSLVTDTTGRTLRFQYGRFPGGVRLLSITALEGDPLQLTVQFGYDERGYLESVTRDGRDVRIESVASSHLGFQMPRDWSTSRYSSEPTRKCVSS